MIGRVLKPKMTAARVVSVPLYSLLSLNWYLLGMEMNSGNAHKRRFWSLYRRVPPPPPPAPVCFYSKKYKEETYTKKKCINKMHTNKTYTLKEKVHT